jgi:hypothetical protein
MEGASVFLNAKYVKAVLDEFQVDNKNIVAILIY